MATARKRVKAVHVPFLHVNHPIFQHESHMAAVAILPQIESAYNTAGGLLHITNCPNSSLSRESFVRVIYEAFKANNNDYREEAAVAWADGFTIPPEAIWSDTAALISHNLSIPNFINERRLYSSPSRFSIERITNTLGEKGGSQLQDPLDVVRLHNLAHGMQIPTAPTFQNMPTPPPLRHKYVAVHPAVDKLNYTQWLKGQVIFILTSVAVLIQGIHFSAQHWAFKKGSPSGRHVADLSNPDSVDHQTVNGTTKEDKAWVTWEMIKTFGGILLPTLRDIVLMILTEWEKVGFDSSKLVLFKFDLSCAYNLLDFHHSAIPKLAFALENDTTAIHITGIFGWTGTPYAFQVISRTLRDVINDLILGLGRTLWYIDDCLGVARVSSYFTVIRICVGVINSLLGPTANNVKKEQVGRALDMLGWHIDLDTMAVSIAEHNMQKAIYIFFVKDINGAFTLTDAQRMASLANRYVELCPHMTPYTASLYKFEKGYNAKGGALRHLSLEQKRDVEMWRAFLCLSKFDTKFYARPMRTFLRAKPTYVMNYDASLTGLGVRISRIIPESEQYELMVYTAMSIPFSGIKGDSSHQNMCEYTAVLLGLLLLHQLKVPKHFTYILIGDSMSSLAWMLRQSTNSAIAHNAHIGLTTTALNLDALVAEAFWLESEANFVADGLSRGVAGKDLNLPEDLFFPVVEKSVIDQVIHACNPSQKVQTAEDTVRFTKALIALLHQEEPT